MNQHDHEDETDQDQTRSDASTRKRTGAPSTALPTMTATAMADLLQFSPDALLIINQDGMIVLLNEQAGLLFGYPLEELIGHPLEMLLPECFQAVHVTHRTVYVARPRLRPMGVGLDLLGRRKDGSDFPVDISLRPVLLEQAVHVVGAIRDMTAQRLLERERAQQAERLYLQAELINLAHDAILVRDPISRVLSWNRGAEELYGWTEEEALGLVTHVLLKTHFLASLPEIDAQLKREGRWEGKLMHTRRDGRLVVVESRWVLVRDAQGRTIATLEINRDITERRRLEQVQTTAHATTLAQRTFLQRLLDAFPSSICVVHGLEARLVLANQAAAGLWGAVWHEGEPMREFLEMHGIRTAWCCTSSKKASSRSLTREDENGRYQQGSLRGCSSRLWSQRTVHC